MHPKIFNYGNIKNAGVNKITDAYTFKIHGVNLQWNESDLQKKDHEDLGIIFKTIRDNRGTTITRKRLVEETPGLEGLDPRRSLPDDHRFYEINAPFFFAIPTPTIIDDNDVDYAAAYLWMKVNEHATINEVSVYHAGWLPPNDWELLDRSIWNVSDVTIDHTQGGTINLTDSTCRHPILIRISVIFRENGEAIFHAAGAKFEEQ